MGGMGRCCCTCDCLPLEDLPTVTISGYTGSGWSGDCCYEQTFTPNSTPSWSKSCSGMLYEGLVTEQCVTDHSRFLTPNYRGFEFFPGGCDEIAQDYCCPEGVELIATTTTDWEFKDNAFLAVWRRVREIKVRISQEEVDCSGVEGQTGGCKIVIRSRIIYDWSSKIYGNATTKITQSVLMHNTTCFEANPDFVFSDPTPTLITCSDVPSSPPSSGDCRFGGDFYFDRVKYYETMPTGSVSFGNTDVAGCDSTSCDYDPYSYVSSVCIYGPTGPIANNQCIFQEPCYCTGTITTDNSTISYPAEECDRGDAFILEVDGCEDDPCPELCTSLNTQCANDPDPYECPGTALNLSRLGFDIDPVNLALCFRTGIGEADGLCCSVYGDKIIGCGASKTTAGFFPATPYQPTFECTEIACDEVCCRFFNDCPCCYPDGVCLELYDPANYFSAIDTHTRSQSCTGLQSASVCTSAPTWTITLS